MYSIMARQGPMLHTAGMSANMTMHMNLERKVSKMLRIGSPPWCERSSLIDTWTSQTYYHSSLLGYAGKASGGRILYANIVVPLDGSADSERALPHAQALAKAYNATLHLIQVVSRSEEIDLVRSSGDSFAAAEYSQGVAEHLINARIARADHYLKEVKSRLTSDGMTVETEVLQGSASENIARYAEDKGGDLIVMSTRGQGGIQRFLLGSTTDRVLRAGHLPVLAIPPED